MSDKAGLRHNLEMVLNASSAENGSHTPDFILASYLLGCLAAFDAAVVAREGWYGRTVKGPDGGTSTVPCPGEDTTKAPGKGPAGP